MKIGVLTRNYPPMRGGMSRHALGIAQCLSGFADVEVYAPDSGALPNGTAKVHQLLSRNVSDNLAIVQSRKPDLWVFLSATFAPLVEHAGSPCIVYFHGNDFLNPVIDPHRGLGSTLDRLPGLWRLRAGAAIQALTTRSRQRLIGESARGARLLLFNSRFTRDLAVKMFDLDGVKLEILHPGCDDVFFQQRQQHATSKLNVLTVANLSTSNKRKNVDGVLEAFSQLPPDIKWHYTVIGSGNDLARLKRKAKMLGLAPSVLFMGDVADEVLLEAYRTSDLFVLASTATKQDVEGFGMVYIEANAAGVPVLASAAGATDAIADGSTGILIPDSTARAIAEGLERFYRSRDKFDEDAIRRHADSFRWHRVGDRLRRLISMIVAHDPSSVAAPQCTESPAEELVRSAS